MTTDTMDLIAALETLADWYVQGRQAQPYFELNGDSVLVAEVRNWLLQNADMELRGDVADEWACMRADEKLQVLASSSWGGGRGYQRTVVGRLYGD